MNLTLSVDERILRRARKVAQSLGKSVNQLVREYLEELGAREQDDRWSAELRRLSEHDGRRPRGWKFDRNEIHERS